MNDVAAIPTVDNIIIHHQLRSTSQAFLKSSPSSALSFGFNALLAALDTTRTHEYHNSYTPTHGTLASQMLYFTETSVNIPTSASMEYMQCSGCRGDHEADEYGYLSILILDPVHSLS